MNLSRLFSPCLLVGHEEPIKIVCGKQLHFQCPRCQQDFGVVLPKQKLKLRKEKKSRVLKIARRA